MSAETVTAPVQAEQLPPGPETERLTAALGREMAWPTVKGRAIDRLTYWVTYGHEDTCEEKKMESGAEAHPPEGETYP